MEAFEKWKWKVQPTKGNLVDADDYKEGYIDGLEAGWRAALEWANSQSCLDEYAIEKELGHEVVK